MSLEVGSSLTVPSLPEHSVGVVVLTNEGNETVGAYLGARADTVLPPRRQIARALHALADEIERQADEADR